MKFEEFKNGKDYLLWLASVTNSDIRNKHFKPLIAGFLEEHSNILIRDYLDIDKTFAVISRKTYELDVAIGLYKDVEEYIGDGTYLKPHQTGLIYFDNGPIESGFWISFR